MQKKPQTKRAECIMLCSPVRIGRMQWDAKRGEHERKAIYHQRLQQS